MLQLTEIQNGWQPDGAVVKADEFRALLDADDVVSEARRQADQIVQDAEAEFQRQKEAGRQEGLEESQQAAAAEAVATARKLSAHIRRLEEQLVDLVVRGVEKIVGQCDAHRRIVEQVAKGLEQLAGESKVTVMVCPEEASHVNAEVDAIRERQIGLEVIEIVPDPRLEAGSCILQTEWNVVDAGVSVQLNALREALTNELAGPGATDESNDAAEESDDR